MIDEQTKAKIARVAKKNSVDFAVLFGSMARGKQRSGSDVDIAVLSRSPSDFSHLSEEIGDAIGRNDVEVADLSIPAPFLWRAVAEDGVPLFESRSGLFSEWKIRAQNLWFDTAPLRARQKDALRAWALERDKAYA